MKRIQDLKLVGVLIFIPSYFDYIRVRNWFRSQDINAAFLCEYELIYCYLF